MITIACYLALNHVNPVWSGWLMVLPVLLDLAVLSSVYKGK